MACVAAQEGLIVATALSATFWALQDVHALRALE